MSIVVTGSVAFDNIMNFPGFFKDHILPDKVHMLSVSFLLETMQRMHGGAAANIAYNLALLSERPSLLAAVGDDFDDYRKWLEQAGVDTSPIQVIAGEYTATAFITTDKDDNQITGFYPGAMREAGKVLSIADIDAATIDLVVISPDDPEAMAGYPGECRDLGVPFIFSPGQQIVSLDEEQLMNGIKGAQCLIGNDYEMEMIAAKIGRPPSELLGLADVVITTFGDKGSKILTGDGEVDIPAARVPQVADPTGAGDAYVAGVAFGLLSNQRPESYGRIASLVAAHAVEHYGTQSHSFTTEEFDATFASHFGEMEAPALRKS
jgi:adenosine kinase